MHRIPLTLCLFVFLTGCVSTGPAPVATTPYEKPVVQRSASNAVARYRRVIARVEPVSERACLSIYPRIQRTFCDFVFKVDENPKQPPNAFQSIGPDGRPVITFNIAMLQTVKNDHEIAFILGHEAGHQIAQHINQKVDNATTGAILGGLLMASIGADPQAGVDLGGMIGGQAYSKKFELQADRIGRRGPGMTHSSAPRAFDARPGPTACCRRTRRQLTGSGR